MQPQRVGLLRASLVCLAVLLAAAAKEAPTLSKPNPTIEVPRLSAAAIPAVPDSEFKKQYQLLSAAARKVTDTTMKKWAIPAKDVPSLRIDSSGRIFYVEKSNNDTSSAVPERRRRATASIVPDSYQSNGLPIFHSKPGSSNTMYLDFDGHTTDSSSMWGAFSARAYDPSANDGASVKFSTYEASQIGQIWKRVAEDYLPFNIDVTTQKPSSMGIRDLHVVITSHLQTNGNFMPASDAGGVAYLGIFDEFGSDVYKPALVYYTNLAEREDYIAEATSHEAGHNFGLSHDGSSGEEYSNGDADGSADSWAPIMGVGYDAGVSQWSKGEYTGASNKEDDVSILSGELSYRTDDHGSSRSSATALSVDSSGDFSTTGIIERSSDVDYFKLTVSGAGTLSVSVEPLGMPSHTAGHNLDAKLVITDSSGSTLQTSNPTGKLDASATVSLPSSGTYYILVSGTGHGTSKYSDYASLGHYDLVGRVDGTSSPPPPPPTTTQPPPPSPTTTPSSVTCKNDIFEPNDFFYTGSTVSTGSYSLTACGDDDFFVFTPTCDEQSVTIRFSADLDLDLYVYNEALNLVAKSNGFSNTETVTLEERIGAKLYIFVSTFEGSGGYTLEVDQDCTTTTPEPTTSTQEGGSKIVSGSNYRRYTMQASTSCTNNMFRYCLTVGPTKKGFSMKLSGPTVIVGKKRKPLTLGSVRLRTGQTRCIIATRTVTPGETYTLIISGRGSWDLEYSTLELKSSSDCTN